MFIDQRLKKWMLAFCIAMLACICCSFISFQEECDEIRTEVFRLHVLANSDSEEDQAVKLQVRDAILAESETLFAVAGNKKGAMQSAQTHLADIEAIANQTLQQAGSVDKAKVEICNMYFTTRYYENYTLPAGYYDALRVTIGKAEGQNWWCVLYPSLCLPTASAKESSDAVFTEEQQDIVENGVQYQFSFALVEWIESLKQ